MLTQKPKRYRYPAEIISYAIWMYHRFNTSYRDIEEVRIYMDGNKMAEDGSAPYGYNFELSPSQMGKHEFEVVVENEKGNKDSDKIILDVAGYL